jgi:hypothetical protein
LCFPVFESHVHGSPDFSFIIGYCSFVLEKNPIIYYEKSGDSWTYDSNRKIKEQ